MELTFKSPFEVFCQICFAVYLAVTQSFSRHKEKSGSAQLEQHLLELMNRHGNRIFRLAYSYLHNAQDAEEILQDTLVKYLDSTPDFESDEHEKAWLLRVASNLSKNKIEYNKVRETDELNDELIGEERQDLSFVWEVVKALPDNYREVIHLFYQEGYQTNEIAEILNESDANIRKRLTRARAKLKDILKEEYDFA